jgi:hypothetical protein
LLLLLLDVVVGGSENESENESENVAGIVAVEC